MGRHRCICAPGYRGSRCQTPICVLRCLNGGTCQAPGLCRCPKGYTGRRCHRRECLIQMLAHYKIDTLDFKCT